MNERGIGQGGCRAGTYKWNCWSEHQEHDKGLGETTAHWVLTQSSVLIARQWTVKTEEHLQMNKIEIGNAVGAIYGPLRN